MSLTVLVTVKRNKKELEKNSRAEAQVRGRMESSGIRQRSQKTPSSKRRLVNGGSEDARQSSSWEIMSPTGAPLSSEYPYQGLGGRLDALVSTQDTTYHPYPQPPNSAGGRIQQTTRLEDFHTLYRTAHHVPDNQYRDYLRGQTGKRRRDAPILTREGCLQTCAGFSAVATIFLLLIGILMDTQPLYIKGSLPATILQTDDASKPVTQYLLPTAEERLPAARSAYRAGLAYLVTCLACLYALHPAAQRRIRRQYDSIPDDTSSTIPVFHQHEDEARVMNSYQQPNLWSRVRAWLQQWLATRGWQYRRHKSKHTPKII